MAIKSNPNLTLSYAGTALAAYLDQASIDAVVEAVETTNLASTATETTPGNTTWSSKIGGSWAKALDDVLGPDAVTPGTLRTCVIVVGASGAQATYTWTSKAFISNYTIDAKAGDTLKWSGTLNLTGSPVRS